MAAGGGRWVWVSGFVYEQKTKRTLLGILLPEIFPVILDTFICSETLEAKTKPALGSLICHHR